MISFNWLLVSRHNAKITKQGHLISFHDNAGSPDPE
jgi:hypothetical protein